MQNYIVDVLISIAIASFASFVFMRFKWQANNRLGGKFIQHIGDPKSKTMDYFIAGNLNQSEVAFEFMRNKFGSNYTYVNYCNLGWEVFATVEKIAEDIAEHGYKARIFTISVGDHVARYLEVYGILDIQIYAINPCPNAKALRRPLSILLTIGAPIFSLLCYGLGWLSIIPFIPTVGGKYSLMLLADQYATIAYDLPPRATAKTLGMLLSRNDGLLNNKAIRYMFPDVPDAKVVTIDTKHGDTVGAGPKYLQGIEELLEN